MSKARERFGGGPLADAAREILSKSEKSAKKYLKRRWLADATAALREARKEAGLTQEDVAQRLGTKQPAIARLENDREGRFSLARYIEYALACDMMPLDIEFEPVSEVRKYALSAPDAPRTAAAYRAWADITVSGNIAQQPDEETSTASLIEWCQRESFWGESNRVKPDVRSTWQDLLTRFLDDSPQIYRDRTWGTLGALLFAATTTSDASVKGTPQRQDGAAQVAVGQRNLAA